MPFIGTPFIGTPMPRRILIVDHEPNTALKMRDLLQDRAEYVHSARKVERLSGLLSAVEYDTVFLDAETVRVKGYAYWLNFILHIDSTISVIVSSSKWSRPELIEAIRSGASYVLESPLTEFAVEQALAAPRTQVVPQLNRQVRSKEVSGTSGFEEHGLIGSSDALRQVYSQIEKVAATDANVLILGENGTGKELVARALHERSDRSGGAFVTVDMGAISETLFESELFGHKKGAFTDAQEDRMGRFEAASGGTLFLDEIANLPLALQAKLLTVLQKRQVLRIGTNTAIPIDVRLICATNYPIYEAVHESTFRQDLLYRINTVEIDLPPLRKRDGDIRPLADHFLKQFAEQYNPAIFGFTEEAYEKLEAYDWPGNVRELQHMVERAVIMAELPIIQDGDFHFSDPSTQPDSGLVIDSFRLDDVEKLVIQTSLHRHAGNVSRTANELGITRSALYRRLEKHGL